MPKLTDTKVKSLKPDTKTRKHFDSGGLFLEVTPAGSKRWRLRYWFGGKEQLLSLGLYPEIRLKDARERRDEARRLIALGVNPSENRKAQRAAQSEASANAFEVVAREWIAKHPEWAESHRGKVLGRLENDVFPFIGSKPIASLTAMDLLAVLRRVESRGVLDAAHRILGYFGQVLRYAVASGRVERDPSRDLRGALPPIKKQHFPAVTEPKAVGQLLRKLQGYKGSPIVRAALRLAPLVFVRPGELRQAEWKDIDLGKAEWRFTVSKTDDPHIVPLSRQAMEALTEIYPLTGRSPFVFPSARTFERPMSNNAVLAALRTLDVPSEQMCGHGFRATARTLLDEVLGFPPHLIEHQLAHRVRDPLGRAYNRTKHLAERKAMMQAWADYLDTLRTAESEHG